MNRLIAATVLCLFSVAAAQDKSELRYRFEKGSKFPLKVTYSMGVKLDKIPEAFQGVLPEELLTLKFEGSLDMEVKETAEGGKTVLEGTWKTMKAKGVVMINDVDFSYDADKKGEAPKKKAEGDDPALQGLADIEDQLRQMSTQPLKLKVDDRGQVTMDGATAKGMGQMNVMFLSLNGLMGPLPKDAVAKGDSWKGEMKIPLPGPLEAVEIKVVSENTWDSMEDVGGRSCALIKSKFSVAGEGQAEGGGNALNIKMKTTGEGSGKTSFAVKEGGLAKMQGGLTVKLAASFPNPGGGDDLEIKATLKMEQSFEMKK